LCAKNVSQASRQASHLLLLTESRECLANQVQDYAGGGDRQNQVTFKSTLLVAQTRGGEQVQEQQNQSHHTPQTNAIDMFRLEMLHRPVPITRRGLGKHHQQQHHELRTHSMQDCTGISVLKYASGAEQSLRDHDHQRPGCQQAQVLRHATGDPGGDCQHQDDQAGQACSLAVRMFDHRSNAEGLCQFAVENAKQRTAIDVGPSGISHAHFCRRNRATNANGQGDRDHHTNHGQAMQQTEVGLFH